jgi:hypothetical protein
MAHLLGLSEGWSRVELYSSPCCLRSGPLQLSSHHAGVRVY